MKTTYIHRILFVIAGFCLVACVNNTRVTESEYATKIIGGWEGTVGEVKEGLKFKPDSTFVCNMQPTGFLGSTLSQPMAGTVRGTWKINGDTLTLTADHEKRVELDNTITISTIVTFKQDSLVLKSDNGNNSVFLRTLHL